MKADQPDNPDKRPPQKRILPRPGRHETLAESLRRIHAKYGRALKRLADNGD